MPRAARHRTPQRNNPIARYGPDKYVDGFLEQYNAENQNQPAVEPLTAQQHAALRAEAASMESLPSPY